MNKQVLQMKQWLTNKKPLLALMLLSLFWVGASFGQTSNTPASGVPVTTPGNYYFTVPAGVTSITVTSYGAGGGGGACSANYALGGGGAGGSYVQSTITVTPGTQYYYTVGAGGYGGWGGKGTGNTQGTPNNTSTAATAGGATYFGSTASGSTSGSLVLAVGGNPGALNSTAGSGSSSYTSSAGGAAQSTGNVTSGSSVTSIYGAAGGTPVGGTTKASGTGGQGANSGGAGGGAVTSAGSGNNGTAPGGGGSGECEVTATQYGGGYGGNGQITFTYTPAPSLTPSVSSITSGLNYALGSGPSSAQSFTVTGANLTGAPGTITVTGSTDFEVSTTSATSGFGGANGTASISYSAANLSSQTIWVRLIAGKGVGSYSGETISISGGGASSSITATGTVSSDPLVTPSVSTLTGFSYVAGSGPSTAQSLTITGANLTGYPSNLTVTGSTDYEVSTTSATAGFGGANGTATIAFSSATLSTQTIWVRLVAGKSAGNYNSESIAITGGGLLSAVNITASGSVAALSSLAITDNGTPSTISNANVGTTNNILQAFKVIESAGAATTLSSFVANPTGTYVAGDIATSGFKLWAGSTSTFSSATQIGSVSSATGHGENITFSSLNYTIPASGTVYFWLTVDVSSGGTGGNTITAASLSSTAFTFASGSGSITGATVNASSGYTIVFLGGTLATIDLTGMTALTATSTPPYYAATSPILPGDATYDDYPQRIPVTVTATYASKMNQTATGAYNTSTSSGGDGLFRYNLIPGGSNGANYYNTKSANTTTSPINATTFSSTQAAENAVIAAGQYVGFTLIPASGYALNLTTMRIGYNDNGSGTGTAVDANWSLRSSLDNYGSDIATWTSNSVFAASSISLPSQFQSLSANTSVSFRLYLYGNTGSGTAIRIQAGTYVNGSTTITTKGIEIDGSSYIPIATPTVSSVSTSSSSTVNPVYNTATSGGTLYINGTNFIQSGTGQSVVSYDGTTTRATTFISSTQLSIPLSQSDLNNVASHTVTVTNTGNPTTGSGTFTILSLPSLTIADNGTPSTITTANTGSGNNILQAFTITEGGNDPSVLNSVVASLTGTYATGDIANNGFKLWASTSSSFATATGGSNTPLAQVSSSSGHGESITFSNLNRIIPQGGTVYFWITVNINGSGTTGHTIIPSSLSTSAFNFSVGSVSGSVSAGGGYDVNNTSSTLIDDISNQPSGNITQFTTKNVLVGFTFTPTGGTANFTALTVTSTGTATSTDLTNLSIYKDVNNNGLYDAGIDVLVSDNTVTYGSTMNFTMSSQTGITSGTTVQYLITADVADVSVSTIGRTTKLFISTGGFTSGLSVDNSQLNSQNTLTIAAPTPSTTLTTVSGATTSISSLVNTQAAADALSANLTFKITDDGLGHVDNQPTQISSIAFTATTTSVVTDWSQVLSGAELSDGTNTTTSATISSNSITFSGLSYTSGALGYVGSQANKTYTLRVWLKSSLSAALQTTIANQVLALGITTSTITTLSNAYCSQIAASQSVSTSNTLTVTATTLAFVSQPTTSVANVTMATVTVQAVDANGNRALGYSTSISLASTYLSGSPVAVTPVSGLATFSTLKMTQAGTYTLVATSGSLSATSNSFSVSAGVTNLYSNAATLTWDDVTNGLWSTATSGASPSLAWVDGVTANFVTTANTVTVSSTHPPTANGINFGITNCSLTGTGVLTLSGTNPSVSLVNAGTATISAPISATGNVIFTSTGGSTGTGTLAFNNGTNNSYGSVTIGAGITAVNVGTSNVFGTGTLYLNSSPTSPLTLTGTAAATIPNNIVIGSGSSLSLGSTSTKTLTYTGTITGNAYQVSWGNGNGLKYVSPGSYTISVGGAGESYINKAMTYNATTFLNTNSGSLYLNSGADNTLPTNTDVLIATSSSGAQYLNLNGYNQTIASLGSLDASGTNSPGTTTAINTHGGGVTNVGSAVTLTINGPSTTGFYYGSSTGYQRINRTTMNFTGIIGGSGTFAGQSGGTLNNNISLVLASTNNAANKLVLLNQNTYTGSTTVSGGTLKLAYVSGNTIPSTNSVIVSGGTFEIATNQTLASLTLSSGTLIVDAGVTLTVTGAYNVSGGTITNNGTISLSGTYSATSGTLNSVGTIAFTGTNSFSFPGAITLNNGLSNAISNLTVNTTGTVAVSGSFSINGTLLLSAGTFALGNNNVTISSTTIVKSGIVGQVTGSVTYGSGRFIVERFIPKGFRGYRDMAPQVYGAGTINKNWQEGATSGNTNPVPGYGIFITGPTPYAGLSTNTIDGITGFDETGTTSYNTQDYTYTNGTWTAFANTSTNLDAFTGYRLLIRGGRASNLNGPVINTQNGLAMFDATTLRATGKLVTGDVTYKTISNGGVINTISGGNSGVGLNPTKDGFSLVANPYVCPVQWSTVYTASSNINGSYWYLDPTYSAVGRYIAYNALTGSASSATPTVYDTTSGVSKTYGSSTVLGYIQAGQAVFVQTSASNPQVIFQETAKAPSSTKSSLFGTSSLSKIYVNLFRQSTGTTTFDKVDGAAIAFCSNFSNTVYGPQDALKFNNATDNLFISNKGKNLSIDGRLPATTSDVIVLAISKPTTTTYQLLVDATSFNGNGLSPYLVDSYKNTTTALSAGVNTIDFTADTTLAATYANRFSIVFKPGTLPVNSIVASATLSNKVATITWNTVGEKNVASYIVEKSADAKTFTAIGQVTAKNTSSASYNTTDNSITATTYYRIKAVSTSGSVSYSNVAKVSTDNRLPSYSIYPNPLKGNTLNVSLDNVIAGKYVVSISNLLGQKVLTQTISHNGGSASHALTVNATLAAGVYNVTISEAGSKQVVSQTKLSVQP